ncbi:MAG: malQ, partial [Rhizobacter sp.]|nr:malQ [Rhizobacter sp.]
MSSSLEALCAHLGLNTDYHDYWGNLLQVPHEALAAMVGAMGYSAGNEDEAATTLERLKAHDALLLLPPVVVLRSGSNSPPLAVPLNLGERTRPLRFKLDLEDGESADGIVTQAQALHLPAATPLGYHHLTLLDSEGQVLAECRVIVCPERCYEPPALTAGARVWGPSVQLYSLRSEHNWGIGDFGDLLRMVE